MIRRIGETQMTQPAAPTVELSLDNTPDTVPGDVLTAVVTVTADPSNRVETFTGIDNTDHTDIDVTVDHHDRYTYAWSMDGAAVAGETGSTYSFDAVAGPHTVAVAVTDRQDNTVPASVDFTVAEPAPAPAPVRVGFVSPPRGNASNPYGWAEHIAAGVPAQVLAYYNEPGTQVEPFSSLPTIPAGTDVQVRIKDVPADPWFSDWLHALPAAVRELVVSHRHEYKGGTDGYPNADEPLDVWFGAWRFMRGAVDRAGLRGRAMLAPYFMNAWIETKGQRFDDVWPRGANGEAICDLIAFSCYSNESLATYRTPQDLFEIAIDWSTRANVPLCITEWGMQCDSGKPGQTDELRAGVIADTFPYLRAQRLPDGRPMVHSITWWSSLSTNTGVGGLRNDFRLIIPGAELSLAAYKAGAVG